MYIVAVLSFRKHSPVWYPSNQPLTLNHVSKFIEQHSGVTHLKGEEEREEEREKEREQWEETGWQLWQHAERERKLLETDNIELAEQVNQLRGLLAEARRVSPTAGEKVIAQLESMVNQLLGNPDAGPPLQQPPSYSVSETKHTQGAPAEGREEEEEEVEEEEVCSEDYSTRTGRSRR